MIIYPDNCKFDKPIIIDTHAHLDDQKFDQIRDELLTQMSLNGIDKIISCGCDAESSQAAIDLAEKYDFIYAAVGIHPENLESGTSLSPIEDLLKHKKCVAIGEIGLDYYWHSDNKLLQKEIFEQQILLAKEYDLPVIVHDREAHEDTLNILLRHKPKGVLHCFSGSLETARELLKIGMYIGVGGVITFKNAKRLPEVVEMIPDDRFLLETDCPYLAPEPYRGKTCHSGLIPLTAEKIAFYRKTTVQDILLKAKHNAENLFNFL